MSGVCPDCGIEKELTAKGICWKCQVGGIAIKGGCKNCGKNPDEFRVKKDIKSSVTITPKV